MFVMLFMFTCLYVYIRVFGNWYLLKLRQNHFAAYFRFFVLMTTDFLDGSELDDGRAWRQSFDNRSNHMLQTRRHAVGAVICPDVFNQRVSPIKIRHIKAMHLVFVLPECNNQAPNDMRRYLGMSLLKVKYFSK